MKHVRFFFADHVLDVDLRELTRAGEGIAEHHCREQILGFTQQPQHDASGAPLPLRQLLRLPFAQREKSCLREREKETRSRKNQNHHHRSRRWRHGVSMSQNHLERKRQIDKALKR